MAAYNWHVRCTEQDFQHIYHPEFQKLITGKLRNLAMTYDWCLFFPLSAKRHLEQVGGLIVPLQPSSSQACPVSSASLELSEQLFWRYWQFPLFLPLDSGPELCSHFSVWGQSSWVSEFREKMQVILLELIQRVWWIKTLDQVSGLLGRQGGSRVEHSRGGSASRRPLAALRDCLTTLCSGLDFSPKAILSGEKRVNRHCTNQFFLR